MPMNVKVKVQDLKVSLDNLRGCINPNHPSQERSSVLLEADDYFSIQGTDGSLLSKIRMGSNIIKKGAVSVPYITLTTIISHLLEDLVQLSVENDTLYIQHGKGESKIRGMAAIGNKIIFPDQYYDVNGRFLDGLEKTTFTTKTGDTRAFLGGVLLKSDGSTLTLASSDGFRISEYKYPIKVGVFSVVVPVQSLRYLQRLKITKIFVQDDKFFAAGPDIQVATSVIKEAFIDYSPFITLSQPVRYQVPVKDVQKACEVVSPFSLRDSAKFTFDKTLKISTINANAGASTVEIDTVNGKGSIEVWLSLPYTIQVLKKMSKPEIEIAIVQRGEHKLVRLEEPNYIYVVGGVQI